MAMFMATKKPEIVIMVGNIGSGKSTLVGKYVEKGYLCVSRDALRYMVGAGKYIYNPIKIEESIFACEGKILRCLMLRRFNIVVDEVGVSKKFRYGYLQLARQYGYNAVAHVMRRLPKEICVERRMNNNHGDTSKEVWNRVWEKFNASYEEPSKTEGFTKIKKES